MVGQDFRRKPSFVQEDDPHVVALEIGMFRMKQDIKACQMLSPGMTALFWKL